MNQEKVLRDLATLPPSAQQEVVDFIAFLQTRYKGSESTQSTKKPKIDFMAEPFFGIWRDREETQDSTTWVRNLRKNE